VNRGLPSKRKPHRESTAASVPKKLLDEAAEKERWRLFCIMEDFGRR
jgi:hypothetical protein